MRYTEWDSDRIRTTVPNKTTPKKKGKSMIVRSTLLFSFLCILLAGCRPSDQGSTSGDGAAVESEKPGDGEGGLNIEVPGVDIEAGKDGLKVKAPGVDVEAGKEEGLKVKAPGVDVKANRQEGVEVQAPDTDVKLNRQEGLRVKAPGTDVKVDKEKGVEVEAPNVDVKAKAEK